MTEEAGAGLKRLALTIVYEPDGEWVMASIPAVPGVLSQGRTREEAREMVLDALAEMVELREAEYKPSGGVMERVVLVPDRAGPISLTDTRISAMHERGGTREATPEEFEEFCREHGPFLPPDGEG